MRPRHLLFLAAIPVSVFVLEPAFSRQRGVLPFDVVQGFNVGSLTRTAAQSCGQCHANPGQNAPPGPVAVTVAPLERVLAVGATTQVAVASSSNVVSTSGGFTADVTSGTLVAGANTRTNPAGTAITHALNSARSWNFSFRAPTTPGLSELYVAVNHGNNDTPRVRPNAADRYAFHGSSPTNTVSTPVRFYTNAPGCVPLGSSCSDGFGNVSVLGSPLTPTIGQAWRLEAHGLPPASPLLLMIDVGGGFGGLDMGSFGAPTCVLWTRMLLQVRLASSAGNAERAEGTFTLPTVIPNDQSLRSLKLGFQVGVIDANSTRPFPFTTTNGLEITIQ